MAAISKQFIEEKQRVLGEKADLSRKGAIDAPVADLVQCLNEADQYYTTSSCSGRILVYTDREVRKKGCQWLLISHDLVTVPQLMGALADRCLGSGYTFFKFEPFVLHVVCSDLTSAQNLLCAAVGAGFRNSGIMIGKKQRFILAVRSTHTLEAPIGLDRQLLVSDNYLTHLVTLANDKLTTNFEKINRFQSNVKCLLAEHKVKHAASTQHQSTQHHPQRRTALLDQPSKREESEKPKYNSDIDVQGVDLENLFGDENHQ